MSLMIINQDHYALETVYTPGDHTYTREQIGTRYLFIAVRTLVDPADPEDVKQARRCKTQSRSVSQAGPARSKRPTGTKQARTRCATRFLCSTRRCRI